MLKFQKLIDQISNLKRPDTEKTVFSIGGRGHYENPISDILAFFVDPKEVHGFGALFLSSLAECADLEELDKFDLTTPPSREVTTKSGKRIDLVIEGEQWVVVVENKIQHSPNNPFDEYIGYISEQYPQKNKYFILLTIRKEVAPRGWINITYEALIDHIKKNIGYHMMSPNTTKWFVILREFILNLQEQIGEIQAEPKRIKFVRDNYQKIQEIMDMHEEYVQYIIALITESMAANTTPPHIRRHNWPEGLALRVSLEHWKEETNITLLLVKDGALRIQAYIYNIHDSALDLLRQHVDSEKYEHFWTESKKIRCFGFFDSNSIEEVLNEMNELAMRINAFYEALERDGGKGQAPIDPQGS